MKKKRPARLKRRLFKSYLTTTVSITLVLFLVGVMSLLLLNAGRLSEYVREHVGFTLMLQDHVREVEVLRLQKTLNASRYVKSTEYVDKDKAAAQLTNDLGEDFIGFLGFNPLFSSIEVRLHSEYMNPDSLSVLEKNFLEYPQVKEVYYQRDLVDIIHENVQKISLLLIVFSALLLFIFSTLINNTIRISIYSQRFIINTMKLVGATRGFIRRPFILKSMLFGALGGLIANSALIILVISYQREFQGILDIEQVETIGLTFSVVFAFGLLITWISTHLSVNRFLRLRFEELFY
ncbi:cell division protein FtsX [Sunxiuqinia sp. A32]|uniref:cell division protein FtsX n=1 Tax=Sunxiuqinia sp. A32 TaxID=3461496 RepID=UPI0040463C3B